MDFKKDFAEYKVSISVNFPLKAIEFLVPLIFNSFAIKFKVLFQSEDSNLPCFLI